MCHFLLTSCATKKKKPFRFQGLGITILISNIWQCASQWELQVQCNYLRWPRILVLVIGWWLNWLNFHERNTLLALLCSLSDASILFPLLMCNLSSIIIIKKTDIPPFIEKIPGDKPVVQQQISKFRNWSWYAPLGYIQNNWEEVWALINPPPPHARLD